jgi:hypothetical protein
VLFDHCQSRLLNPSQRHVHQQLKQQLSCQHRLIVAFLFFAYCFLFFRHCFQNAFADFVVLIRWFLKVHVNCCLLQAWPQLLLVLCPEKGLPFDALSMILLYWILLLNMAMRWESVADSEVFYILLLMRYLIWRWMELGWIHGYACCCSHTSNSALTWNNI